jgi:hypothetical protein
VECFAAEPQRHSTTTHYDADLSANTSIQVINGDASTHMLFTTMILMVTEDWIRTHSSLTRPDQQRPDSCKGKLGQAHARDEITQGWQLENYECWGG